MRKPRIVSSDFARINGGKDLARIFTLLLEQANLSGPVDDVRLLELQVAAIQEILRHALLKPLGTTHTLLAEVVRIGVDGLVPLPAAAAGPRHLIGALCSLVS